MLFTRNGKYLLSIILILLFGMYVLYPLAMLFVKSFGTDGGWSVTRYRDLLDPGNAANVEAVKNSVVMSLLSVIGAGLLGTFFAFVFTQCDMPFRRILSRIAIVPVALPPLVGVLSFLFLFGESGILPRGLKMLLGLSEAPLVLEGIPAVIAIHAYSFYVYFYTMGTVAFRQIDGAMIEAASGMGSGFWRTLRHVMLPELRPALAGAAILTFMASMASFSAPFLFAGDKRFITLQIFSTKLNGDLGLASAESILLTMLSMLFFVFLTLFRGEMAGLRGTKGTMRTGRIRISRGVEKLLVSVAFVLLGFVLLPVAILVLISFASAGSWTNQLLPTLYTFDNYTRLFSDAAAFLPFRNSIVMSLLAMVVAVGVGLTGALLLVKGRIGKWFLPLDLLTTVPYAVPGTVVALALIVAFNRPTLQAGNSILVGTFWILPLAYVMRTYPLVVRSTASALQQVDDALLEAAAMCGASPWRKFRRVLFPMVLPALVSGAMLTLIAGLGEFVSSIMLYSYSSRPVSVEILAQLRMFDFGAASACAVLLLGVILGVVGLAGLVSGKVWESGPSP